MILTAVASGVAVSLAELPWLTTIDASQLPSLSVGQLLLSLPSNAVTVLRSSDHRISRHQRFFHSQRIHDTLIALRKEARTRANDGDVALDTVAASVDHLADHALATLGDDRHELLLTILAVAVPSTPSPIFVGHTRLTESLAAQPLSHWRVGIHGHARWLAPYKHSQWAKDRHALQYDAVKSHHSLHELILHSGQSLYEGLVTNIAVIDHSGNILTPAVTDKLLPGYFRSLLLQHLQARESDVTINDIRAGKFAAMVCVGTGSVLTVVDSAVLPTMSMLAQCDDSEKCQCLTSADSAADSDRCYHFTADAAIDRDGATVSVADYVAELRKWLIAELDRQW